jgi:hypothetical protein
VVETGCVKLQTAEDAMTTIHPSFSDSIQADFYKDRLAWFIKHKSLPTQARRLLPNNLFDDFLIFSSL